jgi:hypothetical protein
MSQVDYIHFFNALLWSFCFMISFYIILCIIYVRLYYKILGARDDVLEDLLWILMNIDYSKFHLINLKLKINNYYKKRFFFFKFNKFYILQNLRKACILI